MHPIHIVLRYQISDNVRKPLTYLWQGRIIYTNLIVILGQLCRDLGIKGRKRNRSTASGNYTIRIDPCMELHIALMRLVQQKLQHIISRILPCHTSNELAPRLIRRIIKSIRIGTNLDEYSIDVHTLENIQIRNEQSLLRSFIIFCSRPIDSTHSSHPGTAQLMSRNNGSNTSNRSRCGSWSRGRRSIIFTARCNDSQCSQDDCQLAEIHILKNFIMWLNCYLSVDCENTLGRSIVS